MINPMWEMNDAEEKMMVPLIKCRKGKAQVMVSPRIRRQGAF